MFNINTIEVDVDKIQNTKARQSLIERLFNYGTFSIDTSGSEGFEIEFKGVPNLSRKQALIKSIIESDIDAIKEYNKRVRIEKKLEKQEKKLEKKNKILGKLKEDIKILNDPIKTKESTDAGTE